jgi:hypothetical protein
MGASFQDKLTAFIQGCSVETREGLELMVRRNQQAGGTSFENTMALCVDRRVESKVRSTACWVLGRLEDAGAVPMLVQALSDDDPGVRSQAAN